MSTSFDTKISVFTDYSARIGQKHKNRAFEGTKDTIVEIL